MNAMHWLQQGAAWAWHTSWIMAVPGLILLALGRWRTFSARWRMMLAGVLFIRLLVPVVPEVSWHPMKSWVKTQSVTVLPTTAPAQEPGEARLTEAAATPVLPSTAAPEPAFSIPWQAVATGIWTLGVLAVAGWLVRSQMLIRRWVLKHAQSPDTETARLFCACLERMGLHCSVRLLQVPHISTAAVWGWLQPTVLLPTNLRETHTEDEIRGILLHELAHVRRWDVLWSWIGLTACALHWFNPLAWLALRRFHADRELDCDRMALENLTAPQRSAYAPALFKTLQLPTSAAPMALVPFFRSKHEIHTRILTIMKPAKSLAATLAALLVIPTLSLLSLTTAGADEEKPASAESPEKRGDGDKPRSRPRDGETRKEGARDGDARKDGPRDGEDRKEGPRDGEMKREGQRDGEARNEGARDGEGRKEGARDGEMRKEGARDGEGVSKGPRDGEPRKDSAEGDSRNITTLRVLGDGSSVSVNGETIPSGGLRGHLSEYLATHPRTQVIVAAEDQVPYKAVMDALDAARDCGAKNARLLTQQQGGREDGRRSAEAR